MAVKNRGKERTLEMVGPGVLGTKLRGVNDVDEILVPYILAQSAVPVILPSSGSSNATGQITLTTALPYQPSGTVYIYLPTGVVTAGSAGTGAGLYPVVFSSTTVCQVQGTGIVSANGAYTQTTAADITLATVVVPGGAMGANGAIREHRAFGFPNNANNKIVRVFFGGSGLSSVSGTYTTASGSTLASVTRNRGSQSLQATAPLTASTTASTTTTVDTSVNQNMTIVANLAVATDYIILEGYTVEVLPSA